MRVVGVRGATTCESDTADEVAAKTQELVRRLVEANGIRDEDFVSIILTATDDVSAAFPATAVRSLGYEDVPLMGARELSVTGGVERCIRVLIHCYSDLKRAEVRHVYLENAKTLRDDLAGGLP